jgi:DNA repair exonuclease SbcCD nuclease subunit
LIIAVHSSDVHVNDAYVPPEYGGDGTAGLRAVLEAARALDAHVVLLVGDTFEHNRLPDALIGRARALLAEARREVVILPGNHDPAIDDAVVRRIDLPNVHVLGVTASERVRFDRLDLEVWGNAHLDYHDMAPLARPPERAARWRIALAHGHYEPDMSIYGEVRPSWLIGDDDLAAAQSDYVALGHWNRAVRVGGRHVEAHYSGSPDFAQTVNVVRLSEAGVAVTREPLRLTPPPGER